MKRDINTPLAPIEQNELFIEIGEVFVPSEVASPDITTFTQTTLDAIRKSLGNTIAGQPTLQQRMDERRRERVKQERLDYLSANPQENTQVQPSTHEAVGETAIQGSLNFRENASERPSNSDIGKKVAFGGFLKKAIHDVSSEKNTSLLAPKERGIMHPTVVASKIFKDSRDYRTEGLYVDGVLLNQVEYRLLPRSPRALATSTVARTLGDKDIREDSNVMNRADRSVVHVFESKEELLQAHTEKLKSIYDDLGKLSRLVHYPGFAHVDASEMTRLIAVAWNEFNNMVHVVGTKERWDQEHVQVAEIALVASFTEGPQNIRVRNFADQLRFAKRYVDARHALFTDRLKLTQNYTSSINNMTA